MDGIFQLLGALISLMARLIFLVVATPLVLCWPRQDKSLSYGQTVWSRYKRILSTVLAG